MADTSESLTPQTPKKSWLKQQLTKLTESEMSNAAQQLASTYGNLGLAASGPATVTTTGGGPLSGSDYWPQRVYPTYDNMVTDPWTAAKEQQSSAEQQAKTLEILKRALEQQHHAAEAAKRRLSKRELMAGALKEMTAIRERLDQLTAILTTEALTGNDEPEAEQAASYNSPAGMAGQPVTVSSINQLIDAKLGLK